MTDPRILDRIDQKILASNIGVVRNGHLNLAGTSGADGGSGTPPGGFQGQLIQGAITYDSTEAATLSTSATPSLLDNLNHLRWMATNSAGLSEIGFYQDTDSGSALIGTGSNIAVDSNFVVSMNGQTGLVNTAPNFLVSSTISTGSLYGARYLETGGSGLSLWDGGGLWDTGWIWDGNGPGDTVALFNGVVDIDSYFLRLRQPYTPASGSAAGVQGTIAWDDSAIYVCVETNHWKKADLSDF